MSFWVVIEPFLQGFAVREDERMPAPACDGHDLRVLRCADDERLAAVCLSLLYDTVDAADERACCIDDLQPARLQRFIDGARDAVRADDDGASRRDLLGRGDLPHAERGKMLHDVVVMDDRPERDGALAFAHGLLHQTDRAVDPETEPGRSSYADGHCMPPSA